MHNAEAAIEPAFYDHEDDTVQRDRAAADWGADEVFASVPRRRFRGDHHASATRRAPVRRVSGPVVDDADAAERAAWLAEIEAELAAADAPAPPAPPAPPVEALHTQALTEGVEFDAPNAWTEAPADPAARRTVTITGRPERTPVPARPLTSDRRRPPRTVEERLGARPDRLAGWSFGMGLLLIVVAAFS